MIKNILRKAFRNSLAATLLFVAGQSIAQTPAVNISMPLKVEEKTYVVGVITADSSGYYLIKTNRKTYDMYIEKMDRSFKSLYSKKPEFNEDEFFLWRMFNTKNTIQSIIVKNIKAPSKKVEIYTVIFNKVTAEYSQPVLLTTLDNMQYRDVYFSGGYTPGYNSKPLSEIPPSFWSDGKDIDVEIACADNGQHMYLYMNPYQENNEKFKFTVSVFDEQGKKEWNREITMPYLYAQYYGIGMQLDKSGQNFILGSKIYKQSRGEGKKIEFREWVKDDQKNVHPNYDIQILQYNANSSDHVYTISPRDNFIDTLDFAFDNQNNMYMCGKYSLDNEYETLDGIVFAKVNLTTNKMLFEVQDSLPADATDSTTDDVVKKIHKVYLFRGGYKVKQIFPQDDGSVMICLDYAMKTVITTQSTRYGAPGMAGMGTPMPGQPGTYTSTHENYYYFDYDFLAVKLQPDGSIGHVTDIPKKENSGEEGTIGNCVFQQGNNFVLLYCDDPDNMHIKIPTKISKWSGGNYDLIMATIYPNGCFNKQVLLNKKKNKVDETPFFGNGSSFVPLGGKFGNLSQGATIFMMHWGLFKGYSARICEVTGL